MSLPSSMADFVPCDHLLQKAYKCGIIGHFARACRGGTRTGRRRQQQSNFAYCRGVCCELSGNANLDPSVTPVHAPTRRVPVAKLDRVNEELKRLWEE